MNRRNIIQLTSAGCIVSLTGCSGILGSGNSEEGDVGGKFEEGNDEQAIITLDYFDDDWEENERAFENGDYFGSNDGMTPEILVSTTNKRFHHLKEDRGYEEWIEAGIGIAESIDGATERVNYFTTERMDNTESIDLGDGGERGDLAHYGAVGFFYSNAAIMTTAVRRTYPNNRHERLYDRAHRVGEDLLENLKSL